MRSTSLSIAFLVLLALASGAQAAEPSFDDFLLTAEDLPRGYRLVEGIHAASVQPNTFYEMPDMEGLLPKPERKAAFSFATLMGKPGTIYLFEYAEPFPRSRRGYLAGLLYGEGGRSQRHPEEVMGFGRYLLIVSFPWGDPVAEWYKARLREKLRLPAPRDHPEERPVMQRVFAAYAAGDYAKALALMDENAKRLSDLSFAHYLRGVIGLTTDDYPLAEKGYRRAIELHDSLVDPLGAEPDLLWASLDGLGAALVCQKKLDAAVEVLTRAEKVGASVDPKQTANTEYNLACAFSLKGDFEAAHRHLVRAIEAKPEYRDTAKSDADLAEARKREEFRKLLGE